MMSIVPWLRGGCMMGWVDHGLGSLGWVCMMRWLGWSGISCTRIPYCRAPWAMLRTCMTCMVNTGGDSRCGARCGIWRHWRTMSMVKTVGGAQRVMSMVKTMGESWLGFMRHEERPVRNAQQHGKMEAP
jgi:hypothetical protein